MKSIFNLYFPCKLSGDIIIHSLVLSLVWLPWMTASTFVFQRDRPNILQWLKRPFFFFINLVLWGIKSGTAGERKVVDGNGRGKVGSVSYSFFPMFLFCWFCIWTILTSFSLMFLCFLSTAKNNFLCGRWWFFYGLSGLMSWGPWTFLLTGLFMSWLNLIRNLLVKSQSVFSGRSLKVLHEQES